MKKAVSLMSGGLDCCVATSMFSDFEIHALTFDYGQKALNSEVKASKKICEVKGWSHEVISLNWLGEISNSSLTSDESIAEVSENDLDDLDKSLVSAENVWVPGRNTVFVAVALSYAESLDASVIITGWNREEGLTFPDNSKQYLNRFNELIKTGSPKDIVIEAPCIDMTKEEIVKLGYEINAPMDLSYSCYKGGDEPCGVCESCMRRERAFKKVKK